MSSKCMVDNGWVLVYNDYQTEVNMKTKLLLGIVIGALLISCISGCLFIEYEVGGEVSSIDGYSVGIIAQLWRIVGSGVINNIDWLVSWGDGTQSGTNDGSPAVFGDASPRNPLTFMTWQHTYEEDGEYCISVSCSGSTPMVLFVDIE